MMGDRRIIAFDGDQYLMTVPDEDTLRLLADKQLIWTQKCYAYHTEWTESGTWFTIIDAAYAITGTYARYRFHENFLTARDTNKKMDPLLFRPMLLPLDKTGRICCERFKQDNPNGTRADGGTACYDGVPIAPGKNNLFQDGHTFGIMDTQPGNTLNWVCWNGRLYCTESLICIPIENLEAQAAVFPELDFSEYQ